MAFTKQKQYDPTEAFLLNEKQQKLLVLQLQEIDKLWYKRLKHLTKDRLEATTDLVRIEDGKKQLEYYNRSMEVHKMKEYNDGIIRHMRFMKRELTHDNFNFDSAVYAERRRPVPHQNGHISLPRIDNTRCFVTQPAKLHTARDKHAPKRPIVRRQSNLMKNKIFSVSEPNIDMVPKLGLPENRTLGARSKTFSASQDDVSSVAKVNSFIAKLAESQGETNTPSLVLPNISEKPEEPRYLKQRMATQIVLPTVTETEKRQRKISV